MKQRLRNVIVENLRNALETSRTSREPEARILHPLSSLLLLLLGSHPNQERYRERMQELSNKAPSQLFASLDVFTPSLFDPGIKSEIQKDALNGWKLVLWFAKKLQEKNLLTSDFFREEIWLSNNDRLHMRYQYSLAPKLGALARSEEKDALISYYADAYGKDTTVHYFGNEWRLRELKTVIPTDSEKTNILQPPELTFANFMDSETARGKVQKGGVMSFYLIHLPTSTLENDSSLRRHLSSSSRDMFDFSENKTKPGTYVVTPLRRGTHQIECIELPPLVGDMGRYRVFFAYNYEKNEKKPVKTRQRRTRQELIETHTLPETT